MGDRIAALQQLVSPFGKVLSLSLSLSANFCFTFQKDDECVLVYLYTVIITYHVIVIISLWIYFICKVYFNRYLCWR